MRSGCGTMFALVAVAACAPGFALALAAVTGVAFAGQWVGEHPVLLTIYCVGALAIAYGVPVFLTIAALEENILWVPVVLVGSLLAASIIFAVPSSFVAMAGCRTGNDNALWAMRAIPAVWAGETFLADEDEKMTCSDFD